MSGKAEMAAFVKRLEAIATPQLRKQLAQKLGGVVIRLINEEIDRGVDPYGLAWKKRIDGATPLQGFKNTFTAIISDGKIRAASSKWYAVVHQKGWIINAKNVPYLRFRLPDGSWASKKSVTIPRRQLIPNKDDGIPLSWNGRMMTIANRFYRDNLQGRG